LTDFLADLVADFLADFLADFEDFPPFLPVLAAFPFSYYCSAYELICTLDSTFSKSKLISSINLTPK